MTTAAEAVEALPLAGAPSRFRDSLVLLWANKLALLGAIVTLLFLVVGAIGAVIVLTPSLQHLYLNQNLVQTLQPPFSRGHLLGTDNFGRDLAWRVAAGTGISMLVGIAVTGLSILFGMALGSVAGYFRGPIDSAISAVVDLTWGFPLLLVAVIVVGVLQPGLTPVVVAVALVNWAGFARIIRALPSPSAHLIPSTRLVFPERFEQKTMYLPSAE